LNAPLRTSV